MRYFLKSCISFYKLFLSPFLGNQCRFYPTCSSYALECLDQFPWPKAFIKLTRRVFSCHPFHPGGFDPVDGSSKTVRLS